MATIRKVEYTYKKEHLRYDSTAKKWVGYQIDARFGGKRHRDTFATKKEAENFITALRTKRVHIKAGLPVPIDRKISLKQLLAARLKKITNEKEIVRATRIFAEFESVFNYPPDVEDVRTPHFQLFTNKRTDTGVKAETVNREITVLSTAFRQAASLFPEELENYEPPRIPRPSFSRRKKHRRVITEKEKDLIVKSIRDAHLYKERPQRTRSRPNVALMFEIAWMLGLRFSEVDRLEPRDLNTTNKTLRVTRWKTNTVDLLEYLPDQVLELFVQAESSADRIFVRHCSDHTFADIIKEACEANGISYGRNKIDSVTFHSTRHSFTTRMMRVTDMATTQSFTGHSNKEMVAIYAHADSASRRRAMERMYKGDFLGNIYEKIRSGEMTLEEFKAAME